jgi:hypothetical protein
LLNATTEGVIRLPFRVLDDGGLIAFHHGHDGVGGAQVDPMILLMVLV